MSNNFLKRGDKMITSLIENELEKYEKEISNITENKTIDCVTIFSNSNEDYDILNNELSDNRIIDEMSSGNLYLLNKPIETIYGDLSFIKVRKYDDNYNNYRISVDFVVDDYEDFKNKINNPVIKKYDTFELIQFKNADSIINIISLSAKEDYKIQRS